MMKFDIKKVNYEGPKSKNPLAFKYYDKDEVINGKKMSEHLKFALSYWHTIDAENTDMFGGPTIDKKFGITDPMDLYKAKADFAFELMEALGIEYYCFHDADIAPEGKTVKESIDNFNQMVDYLAELQKKYGKKLLWDTANNFGDKRFMVGAATSANADVFAIAAAKVKACIDADIKLGGTGYVFWGGREGYDTLLNTDMGLELDNLGRFLTMARDYARSKGFKGDFYIEPKPKEPTKHQYDFDVATCVGFLRKYNLTGDFKMNVEANHATLAMHTFQHELRTARVNDAFGSIDANQGDLLLGWDTDQFPTNIYDTTMCMYEVIKAGGFTNGGLNFDAKTRRASNTFEDILYAYIAGMDSFALGYKLADKIIKDGRIDEFVEGRYASYRSGIGKEIVEGKTNLEKLAEYAVNLGDVKVESGRQEYLESLLNQLMFEGV
ncbi:MAG: xylose isomerase [Clostridia bacterium]|nr:xylose isomerase [Clostridia bacterium]